MYKDLEDKGIFSIGWKSYHIENRETNKINRNTTKFLIRFKSLI